MGPNNTQKIAQTWPQVLSALTPSVKRALGWISTFAAIGIA